MKELLEQMNSNTDKLKEIRETIKKYQTQEIYLSNENSRLNKEIKTLQANEKGSESAERFISKHPGMEYVGKAEGETKTCEGNILAMCNKCNRSLELYVSNSGMGTVIIGVCPKCEAEINFTDYGIW